MHNRNLTLFSFLFIAISYYSCKQNQINLEGDLRFTFFRIGSFYNQPDSIVKDVTVYADTVNKANLREDEKRLLGMYDVLKKEKLQYSPFVNLVLDHDSLIILYLNKEDYDKIKIYHRKELISEHKKIRIKVSAKALGYNMYLCKQLVGVNKIDGQTGETERKLLIEDYK